MRRMWILDAVGNFCSTLLQHHSRKIVAVYGILFLMALPLILFLRIDNTLEKIMEPDPQLMSAENRLKENFGSLDELTVVAYHLDNIFTPQTMEMMKSFNRRVLELPGVKDCLSLARVPWFRNEDTEDGDRVLVDTPFFQEIPTEKEKIARMRRAAVSNPVYRKNLISLDGKTAAFNIVFKNDLSPEEKEKTVKSLMALKDEFQGKYLGEFHISGMHVFMEFTSNFLRRDLALFTVLTVIGLMITMFFCFGGLRPAALCIFGALITNTCSLAVINLLGMEFSVATSAFPAIVMALSAAYSIHIIQAKIKKVERKETVEILAAVFLAGITTTVGFLSLALNPVITVKEFGIFTAIGVFWATAVSILFIPAALEIFPWFLKGKTIKERRPLVAIFSKLVAGKRRTILVTSVLLALVSLFAFRMQVDTNYYEYYNRETQLTEAIDFTNENLAGQYPFVITLVGNEEEAFLKRKNLLFLRETEKFLMGQPGVDSVVDYSRLLDDAYSAMADVEEIDPLWTKNEPLVAQVSMMLEGYREIRAFYVSDDSEETAMVVRTNLIGSRGFLELVNRVKKYMENKKGDGSIKSYNIAGTYIRCAHSADRMAIGQISGSFFAIVIVMLLLFFAIRDLKLTFIAFFPNILPLLVIYGIMGIIGESISMGTATIAAIAIGIAVDDTIHFLVRYRYIRQRKETVSAVMNTLQQAGPSIVFTSVTISIGFFVLFFSSFSPVSNLGIYTAITMIICVLADLLLLPSMLLGFKSK